MKKIQIILMAVLLAAGAGYSAVLVNATFETDTVGVGPGVPATGTAAIFKPVQTAATVTNSVKVTATGPGSGQAVRVLDDAQAQASYLEYNFAASSNAQKSAISFSFALSQTLMGDQNATNGVMRMSVGQYSTDSSTILSSTTKMAAQFGLDSAGVLRAYNNGNATTVATFASGSSHTLAMYLNDNNTSWAQYNVSGTDYNLAGNSVDYWVDGSRVLSGASLQLAMAIVDTNGVAGTIATSEASLGRIGFGVGTAPFGMDVTLDNIQVADISVIPEPATMGMLLLGAVTVLAVRRRRA